MPTTITPLPTPPSRQDPANFANRGDAFLGALPTFTTETNALAAELNALALATGPGLFLNGTVTNPSISFANDTNTGFYLSTTDTIGFAAGGVERAKIDSSGLTLSGGTANGVGYLNASKVLTTGSALTFDGTNFATTGTASGTKFIPTGGSATGNGMYLPSSNTLAWSTNGSERMLLDSSGIIGLGVTPSAWQSGGYKAVQLGSSSFSGSIAQFTGNNQTILVSNAYNDGTNWIYTNTGPAAYYRIAGVSPQHDWWIAPSGTAGNTIAFTQAMTLDSSANLLVGTTSATPSANAGFRVLGTRPTTSDSSSTNSTTTFDVYSIGASAYRFYVGYGGTVYATNTTISAISDQRFKENIRDLDVGLNAVMALKPRKFDWKEGKGKDIKDDRGFIAQEFEQVFPDLIDEWKDPAPEGEVPYKAVRQDLIPVLVKAIQEQQAIIQSLTERVCAMEAKQ